MSPLSPTSPTYNRPKKLNLAMVEDPLLATAASNIPSQSHIPVAPQSPLTPPDSATFPVKLFGKAPPVDAFIDDAETDIYDTMSIPDQEPNYSHAYLVAHAKVYAIAEQ